MDSKIDMQRPRRRRRKDNRFAWARAAVVAGVCGVVVWFGWTITLPQTNKSDKTVEVKVESKKKDKTSAKKSVISQRNFVVLGVYDEGGASRIGSAVQITFDPARNRLGGLVVDTNTFLNFAGRGHMSVSDGFQERPKNAAGAISKMVGVDVEGHLLMNNDSLKAAIESKQVDSMFSDFEKGSISASEGKAIAERMKSIPEDRVLLVDVPVRQINIGEETYYDPDRGDLKRLVTAIWGRPPKKTEEPVRVIILNGNGTPGTGRKAADRLIGKEKGFEIIDVKNAEHFNYPTTEVMVYNKKAKAVAKDLVKGLGVGGLVEKSMAQDVTDIVVLVGKDFN